MFELPIACGGCRARGKAGTMQAGDRDAREGQRSGLTEVGRWLELGRAVMQAALPGLLVLCGRVL